MIHNFHLLLESKAHSDVIIHVKEEKFKAHKTILISRSPVFEAMFQSDLTEKATNTLKIEDIERRVFQEVLRFIYTDEVNQMEEMASDLLAAAEKYMLTLLKEKCEVSLSRNVTVETCSE